MNVKYASKNSGRLSNWPGTEKYTQGRSLTFANIVVKDSFREVTWPSISSRVTEASGEPWAKGLSRPLVQTCALEDAPRNCYVNQFNPKNNTYTY